MRSWKGLEEEERVEVGVGEKRGGEVESGGGKDELDESEPRCRIVRGTRWERHHESGWEGVEAIDKIISIACAADDSARI